MDKDEPRRPTGAEIEEYLGTDVRLTPLDFHRRSVDNETVYDASYQLDVPPMEFDVTVRTQQLSAEETREFETFLQNPRIGFAVPSRNTLTEHDIREMDGHSHDPGELSLERYPAARPDEDTAEPEQRVFEVVFELGPAETTAKENPEEWVVVVDPPTQTITAAATPHLYRSIDGTRCKARIYVSAGRAGLLAAGQSRADAPIGNNRYSQNRYGRSVRVDGLAWNSTYALKGRFKR